MHDWSVDQGDGRPCEKSARACLAHGYGTPNSAITTASLERYVGLATALALHVVAIWALLQFEGVRRSLIEAAPIMVHFITPAPTVPEPPRPQLVAKRRERRLKPPAARPVLSTKSIASPSPLASPEPVEPAPPPPIEAAAPVATPVTAPIVAPAFAANYLHNPPPEYPAASKRLREQGKVMLRVFVSEAGRADKVEIGQSSGSVRLDWAAQEAVRAWRFVPAHQAGQAVSAWVIVPIQFTLEG